MIKIYSFQFNNPEFLHYQFLTFKRFIKEEYELICINNSFDKPHEKEAIRKKAEELNIPHYFPENVNHSKGGYSHQTALQWTWDKFIAKSNDINMIVDHDMFFIKDFSCDLNYDITGIMQGRGEHIKYFHPAFMVINNTLKDRETVSFKGEQIDGLNCDSGGNWHHYLLAHPDLKIKGLLLCNISTEQGNLDILPPSARSHYNERDALQICEDNMIHFRNGSNWAWTEQRSFDRKKEQLRIILNHYMNL